MIIAGVDEAGRGPLAGPVVAAAVILEKRIPDVCDSKLLTDDKREELFFRIVEESTCFQTGIVNHKRIDEVNILKATLEAMASAVSSLSIKPSLVLIDGPYTISEIGCSQRPIIKGDSTNYLISAASIVAKVVRDRMMKEYDSLYPEYGFAQHKGYPTKRHIEAIRMHGPSPIHRRCFLKRLSL